MEKINLKNKKKKQFTIREKLELDLNLYKNLKPKYNIVNSNEITKPLEFSEQSKLNVHNILNRFKKTLRSKLKTEILTKYQNYLNTSVYRKDKKLINKLYTSIINKKFLSFNRLKVKKKFSKFLNKNKLFNAFNLKQDFPYPNFLQSKSEIQRATVFRDLINKEEAYYQTIKKSPLIILLSPKPKNIYVTVYTLPESSTGYNILWKKSTGMLQKVEGQLSLPALIEIFNKLNIFLAKEYLYIQSPVRLIIKSTKYYGTTNIIQNFVKIFEKNLQLNYIYFMYKYRKRFNFFTNYTNLMNDSLFNYLSSIWLKFLKIIKRTKLSPKYIFTTKKLKSYNRFFGIEFNAARRKYKINHFARVKRLKFLRTRILKPKILTKIKRNK